MLLGNNSPVTIRVLGGALQGLDTRGTRHTANRTVFGRLVSVPQGYTIPTRALLPTFGVSGNISAKFQTRDPGMTVFLGGLGNMAAVFAGEADMIVAANVFANLSATFAGEADMAVDLRGIGNISANFDVLARPSAFDIAQEVWNGATTAYTGTGTMGREVQDAKKAAKLAAALSA
jgi:hypothetical protein